MRRSRLFLALLIVAATVVLISLGLWQVRRLAWKENLIATVEARRNAEPVPLADVIARWRRDGDVDYVAVRATGTFDHAHEAYYYTTWDGTVGWYVFTPMHLDDGSWLIVNRGFVPDRRRDPATRPEGQIAGTVELTGLARNPLSEKPNSFIPDNRPDKHEFYWKSYPAMVAAMELKGDVVPFFVDQTAPAVPGGLPKGDTTLIQFPNNHLQYALTWFGLAAACLGVGGWLLFGRARRDGGA